MCMLWAPERKQSQAVQAVPGRDIDDWPTLPSCSSGQQGDIDRARGPHAETPPEGLRRTILSES